jgi:FkbH-like protein
MIHEKNLSEYIKNAKKIEGNFKKNIRIAFLSSFTINGLKETMQVKCAEKQIRGISYESKYNQYNQEILDLQSGLYKFNPDITFLILDTRSILGDLFYNVHSITSAKRMEVINKKIDEIVNLIESFTRNSKSKLIISNFSIPTYSSYGIFETKTEYGFQEMISDLNSKLIKKVKENPSAYVYDYNGFVTRFGENNVFDFKQFYFGDMKISIKLIPYLAKELMGYVKVILGINKKCIVLDLDNTLWGGIVGEDGLDGIKLGPTPPGNAFVEFQRLLLALNERGIILAINSKNNFEDAMEVIKNHPYMKLREQNFACFKINWNDKVSNIIEIAKEINIGLDSIVYFDDDPANRELVSQNLKEVQTVELPSDPSEYSKTLQEINDFNVLKITSEDKKRGQMYTQEKDRKDFQRKSINLEKFLEDLNIKVNIKKANTFTIPRISQLTLKTNQFNLTTQRYQEEDIKKFSDDKDIMVECVEVSDKFGDSGVTGAYVVKKLSNEEWYLDTFLLSCRIIGRRIEEGIMGSIIEKAKKEGVKRIRAKFIPTKKNEPSKSFLPDYGFIKEGDDFVYYLELSIKIPPYLTIRIE